MNKLGILLFITLFGTSLFGIDEMRALKAIKEAGGYLGLGVGAVAGGRRSLQCEGSLPGLRDLFDRDYWDRRMLPGGPFAKYVIAPALFGGLKLGIAGLGAVPGGVLGGLLGRGITEELILKYLQIKYGINKRLASAYLNAGISPTNKDIGSLFRAAIEKDKGKLKEFIDSYLTKRFGSDWFKVVIKTIDNWLLLINPLKVGMQEQQILQEMPLFRPNVLSLVGDDLLATLAELYLGTPIVRFPRQKMSQVRLFLLLLQAPL